MNISKPMVLILLMMRGTVLNGSALTPQLDVPDKLQRLDVSANPSSEPVFSPSYVGRTRKPTQQPSSDPSNVILVICAIIAGLGGTACIFLICCYMRYKNREAFMRHPVTRAHEAPPLTQALLDEEEEVVNSSVDIPVASQVKTTDPVRAVLIC